MLQGKRDVATKELKAAAGVAGVSDGERAFAMELIRLAGGDAKAPRRREQRWPAAVMR
jgi:hypothetical protein